MYGQAQKTKNAVIDADPDKPVLSKKEARALKRDKKPARPTAKKGSNPSDPETSGSRGNPEPSGEVDPESLSLDGIHGEEVVSLNGVRVFEFSKTKGVVSLTRLEGGVGDYQAKEEKLNASLGMA